MKYKKENVDALINFLKKTRNGNYAQIEVTSLDYTRLDEQPDYMDTNEEEYYYSIT